MLQNYKLTIPKDNGSFNDIKLASLWEFLTSRSFSQDNLAEEVIKEKIRSQKKSLEQLLQLIVERERTKKTNIAFIDAEIMDLEAKLYVYKCHLYPINPDHRRKGNLERAISELKSRKRQEEITCWKDTFRLWQELLKVITDYRNLNRKAQVLLFSE